MLHLRISLAPGALPADRALADVTEVCDEALMDRLCATACHLARVEVRLNQAKECWGVAPVALLMQRAPVVRRHDCRDVNEAPHRAVARLPLYTDAELEQRLTTQASINTDDLERIVQQRLKLLLHPEHELPDSELHALLAYHFIVRAVATSASKPLRAFWMQREGRLAERRLWWSAPQTVARYAVATLPSAVAVRCADGRLDVAVENFVPSKLLQRREYAWHAQFAAGTVRAPVALWTPDLLVLVRAQHRRNLDAAVQQHQQARFTPGTDFMRRHPLFPLLARRVVDRLTWMGGPLHPPPRHVPALLQAAMPWCMRELNVIAQGARPGTHLKFDQRQAYHGFMLASGVPVAQIVAIETREITQRLGPRAVRTLERDLREFKAWIATRTEANRAERREFVGTSCKEMMACGLCPHQAQLRALSSPHPNPKGAAQSACQRDRANVLGRRDTDGEGLGSPLRFAQQLARDLQGKQVVQPAAAAARVGIAYEPQHSRIQMDES